MRKYAAVTGANRGLGLAVAQRLVKEGFRVAVLCRRLEDAQATVRLLGSSRNLPVKLDMSACASDVQEAASQIANWVGHRGLDLLVNNAGNSYGWWDEQTWADSRAVNYKGQVALTEALLPCLARGASVTMVGSGLGDAKLLSPKFRRLLSKAESIADLDEIATGPIRALDVDHSWVGPYGLSKALVHRAAAVFAGEHRFTANGIRVNAVCPGWVSTDMGGDQAPITVEEGAEHILQKALSPDPEVSGTFTCFCFKNYDDEHTRAWEAKHGSWQEDPGWEEAEGSPGTKPGKKVRKALKKRP